jgi:NADPH:quinone reductase-like Zn-dependent oxidoreductase
MNPAIPDTMKAAAIDRFGGPEVIHTRSLPVPKPGEYDVLIQLDTAGIGVWDPYVREGDIPTSAGRFPRVIGNDGAGTVVAVGELVTRFRVGERVYAYSMDGGFYAEYVAVNEDNVAPIPPGLDPEEAGALGADGVTALRGLDDELELRAGQTLMIFGASGGIGHIAVQLAKRIGAEVLAVASGADGVELVLRLGADAAIDGRSDDVAQAAGAFAPEGLDAALVLTAGKGLPAALRAVKPGGRARLRRHARARRLRSTEPTDRFRTVPRRARARLSPGGRRGRAPRDREAPPRQARVQGARFWHNVVRPNGDSLSRCSPPASAPR